MPWETPAGEARCLGCGYPLFGLAGHTCPECGRAFNPDDPTTFDQRPLGWRRRRALRRCIIAVAVVVLLFPVFPKRLLVGQVVFRCANCGAQQAAYRWEPVLPQWIPFRLPGLPWRTRLYRDSGDARPNCTVHAFGINVRFDFPAGRASATYPYQPGEAPTLNGQRATPETAVDVLHHLMSSRNFGVGP